MTKNTDNEKMDVKKHIKELMAERNRTTYRLSMEAGLSHSTVTLTPVLNL